MTDLVRIVYMSTAVTNLTLAELEVLEALSRRNNARDGITGALLHVERSFLQVIEGSRAALDDLLGRLRRDRKHYNLTILEHRGIPHRLFPDWTMEARIARYDDLREVDATFPDAMKRMGTSPEGALVAVFMRNFFDVSQRRPYRSA